MSESTKILCAECKASMPDTVPCTECGRKMCDACFDPICGVCLGCPGEVPDWNDEGEPVEKPSVAAMRATQAKDIMQAVDRRLKAFRVEQAINRTEHLDVIRTMLHEHRSDVYSDVARLTQSKVDA